MADLVTVVEAAAILGVRPSAVLDARRRGVLRPANLGRRAGLRDALLFRREEIERYRDSRRWWVRGQRRPGPKRRDDPNSDPNGVV
jgi:hypothetical protein